MSLFDLFPESDRQPLLHLPPTDSLPLIHACTLAQTPRTAPQEAMVFPSDRPSDPALFSQYG